ncbi:DUF1629 domain-containing protein [uncultured Dokdonia sp.]|uniref:imm11 family protein n=1 Tax=uncultured Dokdonia sp. TaxID=575653 RepID=UPI002616BC33|nr:DUF1629 domain-containing protein [uncultured Dokdonia sp.]
MSYYILNIDLEIDTIYIDSYKSNIDELANVLTECKSLNSEIQYIKSYSKTKGVLTDLIDTMVFTVSEKLKNKLFELDSNLEAFPIDLISNGKKIGGYYAINILNKVDAMDHTLSDFTVFEEWDIIDKIKKIVLDPKKINNHCIFREKEISSRIIVNEEVKIVLEDYNGLSFQPLEDYKTPY